MVGNGPLQRSGGSCFAKDLRFSHRLLVFILTSPRWISCKTVPHRRWTNAQLETEGFWRDYAVALVQQAQGDRAAADAALKDFIAKNSKGGAFQIAVLYAIRKEPDEMFKWLDTAYATRDSGLVQLAVTPFFLPYRERPTFRRVVPEAQRASAFSLREAMSEPQFLRRTEAAQRLQGCGRLRSCRMAADAGCQPDFPIFRNPQLGSAPRNSPPRHRFSDCAAYRMGI